MNATGTPISNAPAARSRLSFSGSLTRDPGETVGTYTIRQGTLTAGSNYAITFSTGTLSILYGWDGFLQPINDTAHQTGIQESKFKLGQTIPAKFVIKNAAGVAVQQAITPAFSRSGNLGACDATAVSVTITEVVTPDDGVNYVWDGSQYHYNWSTKGLTAGEYRIYAKPRRRYEAVRRHLSHEVSDGYKERWHVRGATAPLTRSVERAQP